jgi:hypothetical protein
MAFHLLGKEGEATVAVESLESLQWMIFAVPVCGILIAIKCGRSRHLGRLLFVAEILYIFAVAWPLIVMYIWEAQALANTFINSVGAVR